jgi:hypothetical protein
MHSNVNTDYPFKKRSFHPARELTLCEMLDDPIVQDLMRSDRIWRGDVLAAFKLADCRKLPLAA